MKTPSIAMSPFVDRQRDPNSGLTHWEITDEELLKRVQENFDLQRPGYRDGVVLVPVSPDGFKAGIRVLQEGDKLRGSYKARRDGETPRMSVWYECPTPISEAKVTPRSVDVVLYHRDVLAEDETYVETEWNVICVLGKFCSAEDEEPMIPQTLMANHFGDDGGSATGMSPEAFEAALKASYYYWRDKVMLG